MKIETIKKQITFLTHERPLPLEKPKVIQFPVIDICNSRCQMCRIWENKKSDDITPEQLRTGLRDSLFSEVQAVGFNGGEPTLRSDLKDLVQVVVDEIKTLKYVSLITNAYKYDQVIERIEEVAKILSDNNINFDVMVSLDGYGEVHDRVRGRVGNFERAKKVIDFIKGSDLVDFVRIGCTVIRENVYELHDLLDFCIRNDVYIKYRQGVPHQRLYTSTLEAPYALMFEEKYEFVEFLEGLIEHYEASPTQNFFYRSLIDQIICESPRKAGCAWQHQGATITARGELAYCAVKSKVLSSDISKESSHKAYFDNQGHLRSIIQNDCDSCHHDYVGIPDRDEYRKLFIKLLDKKFGLKRRLSSIPGFDYINRKRRHRNFNKNIEVLSALPEKIKLQDISGSGLGKKTILICGWYGTETLGDKAIVGGILESFRDVFGENVKFVVASLNPYVTEMTRRQMPEFKGVDVVSIESAIGMASTVDMAVFGGGPLMAIPPLAPMEIIFERAKKSGAITLAAGVGVGPLGEEWLNESIGRILSLCDYRFYRDERSLKNASGLGINTIGDRVVEDPAFTWLEKVNLPTENASAKKGKVLLLGLRDFPYKEYAKDISEFKALKIKENYENQVIKSVRELISRHSDLIVKPLPMCTNHFGGDDRWFYRRLFRECEDLGARLDYSLLRRELAPSEYLKEFQEAEVLLAMRFHSLVFGLSLGVKCVAIDYTMGKGKVNSLATKFETPSLNIEGLSCQSIVAEVESQLSSKYSTKHSVDNLTFVDAIREMGLEISEKNINWSTVVQ